MELIKVSSMVLNGADINSVNSREIHSQLEIKTAYSNWIKRAIEKYGFEDSIDYATAKNGIGNNAMIDYICTLDMAKELCMIDDSDKGRSFRKYFIQCEKQLTINKPQFELPQNYLEALEALTVSVKENISLTNTIKAKDEVILAVADLNIRAGDVSIGDFSKNLAIENLGRNNLFSWLKARGFLMMNTEPYQQYVERGYFVRKPSDKRVNGEVKYTTMLTPRGTVWLTKMLKAEYDLGEA